MQLAPSELKTQLDPSGRLTGCSERHANGRFFLEGLTALANRPLNGPRNGAVAHPMQQATVKSLSAKRRQSARGQRDGGVAYLLMTSLELQCLSPQFHRGV